MNLYRPVVSSRSYDRRRRYRCLYTRVSSFPIYILIPRRSRLKISESTGPVNSSMRSSRHTSPIGGDEFHGETGAGTSRPGERRRGERVEETREASIFVYFVSSDRRER